MLIDTDAEILRLRTVLRDLVALSTIPVAWVGREPPAVAAGLADSLIGLLQLDFVFVRLCDPGGAGAVDVTRGNASATFPEWLDRHLVTSGQLSGNEIIADVGGGVEPCPGVVIPVGVNAEGGVVAAACERSDFPTEIDELLLSLAANHAATAFQSARLVHERTRAEEELRKARNELEMKVTERTAELRRSEAYLAEAQSLAHTGSFALNIATGEPTHSSDEHSRLFGFDPEQGVRSLGELFQRVHPEDRARCTEALERGIREAESFELEYRIVLPQTPPKYLRAIAHPVFTASGQLEEFVGTVMDVTERKRAEEERQAQLWLFESMDRINRAIQGTSDLEQMMGDVLEVVLQIFSCDRAWLVYPCDPEVASHRVQIERTRPEYMGAFGLGAEIPNDPGVASVFRSVLASSSPVRFDPESGFALPSAPTERFSIRSMIAMAVFPKVDEPYMFGLHQYSHPRVWTPQEERLFQEIGRRLADALDTLLMFRDARDSERELTASRARVVAAGAEERQRVVRDLHDGAQQRLVHAVINLKLALRELRNGDGQVEGLVGEALDHAEKANFELRELAHGILPGVLTSGGLHAGVEELAKGWALPVSVDVSPERFSPSIEATAYFVVSEALTNAIKHSGAQAAEVNGRVEEGVLRVEVRDDGVGGADPAKGSGLTGLRDRVEALGGTTEIASPAGGGTSLLARIPIERS